MRVGMLILAAVMFAVTAPGVSAKTARAARPAMTVINGAITRDEMAVLLQANGYPVTRAKDSQGAQIITTKAPTSGQEFDVYFYDCTGERCATVEFSAGWTVKTPVLLDTVNAWNRDKRYVRAYTDKDGALFAEADLMLMSGDTAAQIVNYLKLWDKTLLVEFKQRLGV